MYQRDTTADVLQDRQRGDCSSAPGCTLSRCVASRRSALPERYSGGPGCEPSSAAPARQGSRLHQVLLSIHHLISQAASSGTSDSRAYSLAASTSSSSACIPRPRFAGRIYSSWRWALRPSVRPTHTAGIPSLNGILASVLLCT